MIDCKLFNHRELALLLMVARGFASWKIRHKEDSPHNECDREFERKRRTNVCKIRHTTVVGWGRGVGSEGVWVGGVAFGVDGSGDWDWGVPFATGSIHDWSLKVCLH